MFIEYLKYDGNNLKFLNKVKLAISYPFLETIEETEYLFRASELAELPRTIKWGTDRGGFPPKMWNDLYPYDDVIFATTELDIIEAEKDPNRSSSFKKFSIIQDPVLLIYDINYFEKVDDRQWKWINPEEKIESLLGIIVLL